MEAFFSKQQKEKVKRVFKRPYGLFFMGVIVVFSILNIYVNELQVIGTEIFKYNPWFSIPYLTLTLANTLLVGLSFTLGLLRLVELGIIYAKASIISMVGSFFALITGACPGCIAGLVPSIAGMFGSTITFNAMPLHGIEIQLLSTLLLLFGIHLLSKETVCKLQKAVDSNTKI